VLIICEGGCVYALFGEVLFFFYSMFVFHTVMVVFVGGIVVCDVIELCNL